MEARLLFIGLWTLADRSGRLEDRPKQIKMEIFPADNVDCDALITEIAATGMLIRYEVGGKRFLQVTNFTKHQNPHRDEKASTIPDQHGNCTDTESVPKKHGASTVQAPCNKDADTVAIVLNPESRILNPDYLNPETPTRHAVVLEEGEAQNPSVSRQAAVCMVIKAEGIGSVNPQHPDLLALIDQGVDVGHFAAAARVAKDKGKGFAYLLGVVKGQMADAALLASAQPAPGAGPAQAESFKASDDRKARERWEQMTNRKHPDNTPRAPPNAMVVDISSRFLEEARP